MKKIISAVAAGFLLAAFFAVSAQTQTGKPKPAALPQGIAGWSGEDSDKLLTDPSITARLRKLMGRKGYASFMESFETVTPITRNGEILFASGCLIHACTHVESAIAVDLKNNTLHAAIFRDAEPVRFFNERGRKTPGPISAWAARLIELKKEN